MNQSPPLTLADLSAGGQAKITSYTAASTGTERLREMGLLPGTTVKVVRLAPMGDPMEVEVRGYKLSLRKVEAGQILIESAAP